MVKIYKYSFGVGPIVSQSRNLRGILNYARKYTYGNELAMDGKKLIVCFRGGETSETFFACEKVLKQWIINRVKYGKGKFVFAYNWETNNSLRII